MSLSHTWSLVVCGGGSGGHLYPALAVVEELRRRQMAPDRILFFTAERSIDRAVLTDCNVEQVCLPAIESTGLLRKPVRSARQLWRAASHADMLLRELPSPVILGTGGFSSVPGVLAARWQRRPIMLLEQNVVPGRATSLLARFADVLCLSFEETLQYLPARVKLKVTGNPVRQDIALMKSPLVSENRMLLVLGGSQGAAAVNQAMLRFARNHRDELQGWTICHQTGERDAFEVRQTYEAIGQTANVAPFFQNVRDLYEQASLVVTRAGGTSLAELSCAGLPAVIIPYPRSLRDHQLLNARHFVQHNAALMVEQSTPETLDSEFAAALLPLISDPRKRLEMSAAMKSVSHPDAAKIICDVLLSLKTDSPHT